jgi:hypothetical protein
VRRPVTHKPIRRIAMTQSFMVLFLNTDGKVFHHYIAQSTSGDVPRAYTMGKAMGAKSILVYPIQ